ncbi:MAG: chromate transporter [Candidatus Cloacimonadales bacterium]
MIQLFKSFFLIGLGAYGGGLVIIPLIQHEIVNKQNWMPAADMASLIAIAQITPGPIAVNSATFVGFQLNSWGGALLATLAVLLPSLLILTFMAPLIDKVKDKKHVIMLRQGIQIGVISLILYAVWTYGSSAISSWLDLVISLFAFGFLIFSEGKIHPVVIILISGTLGLFIF